MTWCRGAQSAGVRPHAAFVKAAVLKLFSLRRLWKILLELRRTSNKHLINAHIKIIVFLLMKHHTEICIIYSDTDMMCGLAYFHCLVVSWISF